MTVEKGLLLNSVVLAFLLVTSVWFFAHRNDAIRESCDSLTQAIRQSQGIPRHYDGRGVPIPTPGELLTALILRPERGTTRVDLFQLRRAQAAYPPLRKATCDT